MTDEHHLILVYQFKVTSTHASVTLLIRPFVLQNFTGKTCNQMPKLFHLMDACEVMSSNVNEKLAIKVVDHSREQFLLMSRAAY